MRVNGITMRSLALAGVGLTVLATGCSSGGRVEALPPDTQVIRDDEATELQRKRTIEGARQALSAGETDESLREALKSVAWSRRARQDLRIEAIEALLADEANLDDTRAMLKLMLPTESAWSEWGVIEYVGDEATRRGWTDLAPAFAASLARAQLLIEDRERAEYAALSRLVGEDAIVDLVFDVFAGTIDGALTRERDRLAAWSLLQRLDPDGARIGDRLRALSDERADEDPLLGALKRGVDELGVVARTGEELAWLNTLSEDEHREFFRTAKGVVDVLGSDQKAGLGLRHLSFLVWASRHQPAWLGASRDELFAHIQRRLNGRKHHFRNPLGSSGKDELFERVNAALNWGDALALCVTLEALDDVGLTSELFRQADLDHEDRTTEHGGVISADPTSPVFYATHYPPRPAQRFGDDRFVASPEMIDHSADALLHYHFHVSKVKNADYAGPSVGDLDYAALYGRAALVFTFIDEDTLGVDYYQPGRTAVDLGEITRP